MMKRMTKRLAIAPLAIAFLASGCTSTDKTAPVPSATIQVTQPSAAQSSPVSPSSTPATPVPPAGGIRVIHTPGIVVDDMALVPGQCKARVIDAVKGLVLPDPTCTPGAIDPAVTQENIDQTICVTGYTSTVRPPTSATNKAKARSLEQYEMTYSKTIEYDHQIPLTLGGASTTSNLWPQPNDADAKSVNNPKDPVEVRLKKAVCERKVTLAAAQQAINADWTTAEQVLGLKK